MAKSLIISVFLAASLIAVTQGLECYSCWDVNLVTQAVMDSLPQMVNPTPFVGWVGSKSCASGRVPQTNLSVTCPILTIGDEEIEPVCSQWTSQVGFLKFTARGCFHTDPLKNLTATEECREMLASEIEDMALGRVLQLVNLVKELTNSTSSPLPGKGELCHCSEDNCNVYEDECLGENPPDRCMVTQPPCTGANCDPAPSVTSGRMSILAGMMLVAVAFALH